jgi:uncharacterized membrane protein YgcG
MIAEPRRRLARPSRPAVVLALAAVLALPAVLGFASPTVAAEPQNLRDQLTDDVGVLTAPDEARLRSALLDLLDRTGVQLWVWFTATTGNLGAPEFAAATAERSGFGGTDVLLVVALDDRAYGYSRPAAFPLSDADLELLLSRELEPGLRAGDYAGAVVEFAAALGGALQPGEPPAPPPGEPPVPADGLGQLGIGTLLIVIAAVLLVGGVVWFLLVRRRYGAAVGVAGERPAPMPGGADPLASLSDDDLNSEANRLLLATDDAVRDSDQELGFAEAQFGQAMVAPFREAIAAAKEGLRAAFAIRQALDDATPEDRPTRRRMLSELMGHCRRAQERLDAEAARFAELRALEREAPAILAGLPAAAAAVEERIPAIEATMARLGEYADHSWRAVAPNLEEARARVAAARAALAEGEKATAAGDTLRVSAAARAGQEAIAQANAFLDAVAHLAAELDQARDRVAGEIAEAEADLARARAAAATAQVQPGLPGQIAEVEALLAGARRDISPPKPDVASAYARARRANEIADQVLAGIRSAAEERAALASRLDTSIRGAQAAVTRAADYVATHRRGVGRRARTRLAEAERHLEQAVPAGRSDPAAGIREADLAARLADEALALAQDDYDDWDDPWHGGRRRRPNDSADVAAVIVSGVIGGLLGGMMGGGGGGRGGLGGGWGGGSFGGGRTSGGGRW